MPRSLQLIQNQPIRFGFTPETCANNDTKAYCNLVQDGDTIQFQNKRILGTDIGCSLLDVSSTQLLANSTFTGSAASWGLTGGWSYGANAVSVAAGSGHVFQVFAAMVDRAMYAISVTTTATSTGGVNVILSDVTIGVIPDGALAGTYTFYGVADTGTSTNVGVNGTTITTTVTTITMVRVGSCFDFDVNPGSSIVYDPILGLQVTGTVNITVTLPFEPSTWYSPKTTLNFSDYQTGTIEFCYDSDCSGALPVSNGAMTWTSNGQAYTTLGIALTDFVGNIDTMTFEQLSDKYYFALYDLDGNVVSSLNAFVEYCREYVIVRFDPKDQGFSHGCYQIGIYDPFQHADQVTLSYDFQGA
jgi:hypothetical protein